MNITVHPYTYNRLFPLNKVLLTQAKLGSIFQAAVNACNKIPCTIGPRTDVLGGYKKLYNEVLYNWYTCTLVLIINISSTNALRDKPFMTNVNSYTSRH